MSRPVLAASTTADLSEASRPVAVWGRRAGIATLALVVLADLGGLLGVHSSTRVATGSGYTLAFTYPAIARPGLDVPWTARVTHPGGFSGPVTLAVTGRYLDMYETQGFHPEPDSETRAGDTLLLTFTPPPGDELTVSYDAYIQPASERGRSGRLALRTGGREVAALDFHTFLWP